MHSDLAREQIVGTPDSRHPRPARQHRRQGRGVRQGHAQAHARGDRRPDLRRDAPLRRPRTARRRTTRRPPPFDPKSRASRGQTPVRNLWVTETALTTALQHRPTSPRAWRPSPSSWASRCMLTGGGLPRADPARPARARQGGDRAPSPAVRDRGGRRHELTSRAREPCPASHPSPRPRGGLRRSRGFPHASAVVAPDGTSDARRRGSRPPSSCDERGRHVIAHRLAVRRAPRTLRGSSSASIGPVDDHRSGGRQHGRSATTCCRPAGRVRRLVHRSAGWSSRSARSCWRWSSPASAELPADRGPVRLHPAGFGDFRLPDAWGYWIAIWAGNAALAVGSSATSTSSGPRWPATSCSPRWSDRASGADLVNILGAREGGIVQLVTTVLKLVPLAVIASSGCSSSTTHYEPSIRHGRGLEPRSTDAPRSPCGRSSASSRRPCRPRR